MSLKDAMAKLIEEMKLAQSSDEILKLVDNPEIAVQLKGAPRERYLKALDDTYGNKSIRGFYDPKENKYISKKISPNEVPTKDVQNAIEQGFVFKKDGSNITVYKPGSGGNEVAGGVSFDTNYKGDKYTKPELTASFLHVRPEFRRNGLANAMYDIAETTDSSIGRGRANIVPSDNQLEQGKKFWNQENRLFGNNDPRPTYKYIDEGTYRDAEAAFDPRFKNSPLLLAGAGAVPISMNPLDALGKLVDSYREKQGQIADAVTERVSQPFGGADERQKMLMRMAIDPINLVEGPAGAGLTAIEMMSNRGK